MAKLRYCEICKQPIDPERAEALVDTRLCTTHAAEIQAFGGEFIVIAHQERTNKAGSLKRNYGGISTTQVRNQEAVDRLKDAYQEAKSGRSE